MRQMIFSAHSVFLVRVILAFVYTSSLPAILWANVDRETYQRRVKESDIKESLGDFTAGSCQVFVPREFDSEMQRTIKRHIENTIEDVGADFHYEPIKGCQVIIVSYGTYTAIDDPDILSSGFYNDKKIRIAWPQDMPFTHPTDLGEYFRTVFRHEFTHLALAEISGNKVPRWLDEGLAVYEEREGKRKRGEGRAFYQKMVKANREMELGPGFFTSNLHKQYTQNNGDFYEQSYVLSKYLADSFGFDRLRTIFKRMKDGASFSLAFQEVCQMTLEELAKKAFEL